MQDDHATDTPGWDAINDALAPLYAGQTPQHFGTAIPYTLGGADPLDGISVYRVDAPVPHWHYITYGFSELYAKESSDASTSGYGFELTFRLAITPGDSAADAPPAWPMNLLQNLARYVFGSGNVFEDGHHIDANGPIALEQDTLLRHLAFLQDPQLPPRQTANGALQFLQVIGLCDAEMAAIRRWSTRGVLDLLEPAMPLWITELSRASLLDDPALAAQVQAGSAREGSSTGMLFLEKLQARVEDGVATLVIGAGQVPSVLELLPLRLRHGKPLTLFGADLAWQFEAGAEDAVQADAEVIRCVLSEASQQALLRTLRAERGRYVLAEGRLLVVVEPTLLRDAKGAVIREIG
ncbi:suppressor of fused domain protein [Stenotrophomonas maltophilia]|uniref:suppressor of fused domain protein n=1 Tax=Stenotrophomonas maltophilia TaxID=40324 RepID=UPI0034DB6B1B